MEITDNILMPGEGEVILSEYEKLNYEKIISYEFTSEDVKYDKGTTCYKYSDYKIFEENNKDIIDKTEYLIIKTKRDSYIFEDNKNFNVLSTYINSSEFIFKRYKIDGKLADFTTYFNKYKNFIRNEVFEDYFLDEISISWIRLENDIIIAIVNVSLTT